MVLFLLSKKAPFPLWSPIYDLVSHTQLDIFNFFRFIDEPLICREEINNRAHFLTAKKSRNRVAFGVRLWGKRRDIAKSFNPNSRLIFFDKKTKKMAIFFLET